MYIGDGTSSEFVMGFDMRNVPLTGVNGLSSLNAKHIARM